MNPIFVNGAEIQAEDGERLIDVMSRAGVQLPQVCSTLPSSPVRPVVGAAF